MHIMLLFAIFVLLEFAINTLESAVVLEESLLKWNKSFWRDGIRKLKKKYWNFNKFPFFSLSKSDVLFFKIF